MSSWEDLIEENLFNEELQKNQKKINLWNYICKNKRIFRNNDIQKYNFKYYNTLSNIIFLDINKSSQFKNLKEIYRSEFSLMKKLYQYLEDKTDDEMFKFMSKLVHYGWKEAIPVTQSQKSLIARVFETIFG